MDYMELLHKLDDFCWPCLDYSTSSGCPGDGTYVEIYDGGEVIAQGDVYTEEDFQRLIEDI